MYQSHLEVVNRKDCSGELQRVIAHIQGESEVEEVNGGKGGNRNCMGDYTGNTAQQLGTSGNMEVHVWV
jgi:hypothetical protein